MACVTSNGLVVNRKHDNIVRKRKHQEHISYEDQNCLGA